MAIMDEAWAVGTRGCVYRRACLDVVEDEAFLQGEAATHEGIENFAGCSLPRLLSAIRVGSPPAHASARVFWVVFGPSLALP